MYHRSLGFFHCLGAYALLEHAFVEKHHDLGRGFFDGAAGDVDHGTTDAREKAPRILHFLAYALRIDVMGFFFFVEQLEPVAADFDEAIRVFGKADKQGFRERAYIR
jgi:hypothetical protein